MRTFNPDKEIVIYWHVDDVKIIDDNLNDEQALAVLHYAKKNHDANCGINWDALSYAIDELFPEIENSLQLNHKL